MIKVPFSFFQRDKTKGLKRQTEKQLGMGKGGTMSQHLAAIRLNKKTKKGRKTLHSDKISWSHKHAK